MTFFLERKYVRRGMDLEKRQEYNVHHAKRAELLAPAGSYETMEAAVLAGADAVYLGGNLFGARAYANNLDTEALLSAIDFVHLHKRKLYLTVNTLLKEEEMEEKLYSYLLPFYRQGLDAVIVQDIGVFSFIQRNFPKLPIHASTQMTLTGVYGAKLLKEMGAARVVMARELSLEEIRKIHRTKGLETLEIESFVHGALCYCYSGQCLFSSLAGGRSGNRGRCAQPCRLPYQVGEPGGQKGQKEERYFLSPKDLCSIELLPDILEAGVYSLKIEGRMKKLEYTAGVVSIYRKYLDWYLEYGRERFLVSDKDKKILYDLYNRGGFTKGYYVERNGKDMIFFQGKEGENESRNQELIKNIRKKFLAEELQEAVCGKVVVQCGERAELTVEEEGNRVTVWGEEVALAQKQPITQENIRRQIEKTGGTPFYFSELSVQTDGKSFIRVTELNELRRRALEQLQKFLLQPYCRSEEEELCRENHRKKTEKQVDFTDQPFYPIHVYLEKKEYVAAAAAFSEISAIYLDAGEFSAAEIKRYREQFPKKQFYCMLPPVFRDLEQAWLEQEYELLLQAGIDGFVVRNLDELSFVREKNRERKESVSIRFDSTLYGFNSESMRVFEEQWKAEWITLPLELNGKELAQIADQKSELIVYGYLPMMVSAQCIMKNKKGCKKQAGILTLTDRYHNEFIVKNRCKFCYNKIYNCKPLSLLSAKKEVDRIAPAAVRLDFTLESVAEMTEILSKFIQAYRKNRIFLEEPFAFTRGHLKRGVE
ncbi:MAG: DUF3656 domain-containing protein [Lachnospiraceae bacterium]|nr:DUF3656 domain-containing protein [Lachnospiraceae bacterium]